MVDVVYYFDVCRSLSFQHRYYHCRPFLSHLYPQPRIHRYFLHPTHLEALLENQPNLQTTNPYSVHCPYTPTSTIDGDQPNDLFRKQIPNDVPDGSPTVKAIRLGPDPDQSAKH